MIPFNQRFGQIVYCVAQVVCQMVACDPAYRPSASMAAGRIEDASQVVIPNPRR